jgi:hypothetical protein
MASDKWILTNSPPSEAKMLPSLAIAVMASDSFEPRKNKLCLCFISGILQQVNWYQ